MNYKISHFASLDLERIWLYTFENWSKEQADRYLNLIFDEIEYVANNPKSGVDFTSIKKGYFKTKIKSHLIFYKVNKKDGIIEVIRVLHQRMDIENRLKDE